MIIIIFLGLLLFASSGNRNNHIAFWISLTLMFDPGGFFSGYYNSVFIGSIKSFDAFFVLISICFMFAKDIHLTELKNDNSFLRFIKYFIFLELYYIIVYGWLTPLYYGVNADNEFSLFIIKERTMVYGFFTAIYVYLFAKRGLTFHYKTIIYSAVFCLSLFLIGFIFNIPIVPYVTLDRFKGEELQRVGMISYGLFQIILSLALIAYFIHRRTNLNLPHKRLIYIGGALLFVVYILTLTRRTLIEVAFLPLIVLWIVSRITNTYMRFGKIVIPLVIAVTLLGVIAPRYITWAGSIYKDISYLLITGKDTRGQSDYRLTGTGDLINVKESIKEKPLLGTGFTWMLYEDKTERVLMGDKFAAAWDAAQEVPIYFVFFSRGFLGFLLYIPVYVFILRALIQLYKLLKYRYREETFHLSIVYIMGIAVLIEFVSLFTVRAFTLFGSLSEPGFMVFVGLLFGIHFMYKHPFYVQKKNNYSCTPY